MQTSFNAKRTHWWLIYVGHQLTAYMQWNNTPLALLEAPYMVVMYHCDLPLEWSSSATGHKLATDSQRILDPCRSAANLWYMHIYGAGIAGKVLISVSIQGHWSHHNRLYLCKLFLWFLMSQQCRLDRLVSKRLVITLIYLHLLCYGHHYEHVLLACHDAFALSTYEGGRFRIIISKCTYWFSSVLLPQ